MIDFILAFSPILVIILLLFLLKKPLVSAAPLTYGYTALLAMLFWNMQLLEVSAATAKGLLVAIDIIIIIFGAIFFLEFLKETKIINNLEAFISHISADKRLQGIIIAWFLASFIEGTAGFGTPAAIVAPLLVGIGFPAVTAVSIALIADSTAAAFGAVGTPIRIGLAGLNVVGVPYYTALINLIAGIIVPVMILAVIVLTSRNKNIKNITEALPFAIWSGIAMTVPYFLASFLGQEFPALIGPLVGLFIIIFTTKKGFLVPKNVWAFDESKLPERTKDKPLKTFMPHILLIVFLIIGKFTLSATPFNIYGNINHSINFFNPGFAFILAILIFSLIYKSWDYIKPASKKSVHILFKPFVAILFITAFVQIMVNSGNSSIPSMIQIIAEYLKTSLLPLIAPFIGGFGAFIAGSATVSNLLFGQFVFSSTKSLGMSTAIILALQVVGAGMGNMIALTNIVAAQATVKLEGKETKILKINFIPFLIYGLIAGIIGLILIFL